MTSWLYSRAWGAVVDDELTASHRARAFSLGFGVMAAVGAAALIAVFFRPDFAAAACRWRSVSASRRPPRGSPSWSGPPWSMAERRLGNRLKEARAARGWTQADLALAVGVSRKTINTIENQVFVPSTVLALGLAQALETTVEALFFLTEDAAQK
jgi:putative transcriptional regulator